MEWNSSLGMSRERYSYLLSKGYKFRKCSVCGRVWNVCRQYTASHYVCMICENRRPQKPKKVERMLSKMIHD